jgi:predicted nucleic acid-binding protein
MRLPVTVPEALLDTCCIINLCAIHRPPNQLFAQFPFRWKVAKAVADEEVSIRPHEAAARHERERIDLRPCFESGIFGLCDVGTEQEMELYIELAAEIDDGEAMSIAIASCRGWSVATDDMPARAAAAKRGVKTYCTPQLLRIWADTNRVEISEVSSAILRIERLARYVPHASLPEARWWARHRGA